MTIVIYHNPKCSNSRRALEYIRATGAEPQVVDYLKTGWTVAQLQGLFAAAGLSAREALREKEAVAVELGLKGAEEAAILAAMAAHPVLVNRPIVCTPRGTRLCRPPEAVLELLENVPGDLLAKE